MENKNLSLGLNILVGLIAILAIIFTIMVSVNFDDVAAKTDPDFIPAYISAYINPYYVLTWITLGICAAATILLSGWTLIKNTQHLVKYGISIGVFAVALIISYLLATGEMVERDGDVLASADASRLVGAGIISFYVFTGAIVALIVGYEVKHALSK